MMKRHAIYQQLLALAWFALATATFAATNNAAHVYPSGGQIVISIGNDLYATLDPKFQRGLNPHAIAMNQGDTPMIAPVQGSKGYLCQVSVSKGFIDLLNHIAHAKAIDQIQPGYFAQYVADLAQAKSADNPPAPANLDDPRYWTDAVMNDQASLCNQMISMTLAMNLSHHYLDHCSRHAAQISDAKLQPINDRLEYGEWEESVKCATLNSLECALATQGAKTLFDCIDQMPNRPAWAAYIVPQGVNIKKLNHELWRYEYDFFHGAASARRDRPVWGG